MFHDVPRFIVVQLTHKNMCRETIDCVAEQKQKYSNAIEKQSIKSTAVRLNGSSYLGVQRDVSVKHLVSGGR